MVEEQDNVVLARLSEIGAQQHQHSAAFGRTKPRLDRIDGRLAAMSKKMRVAMQEYS